MRQAAGSPRNSAISVGSVGLTGDFWSSDHLSRLRDGLAAGEYDMVALGRILLGNPRWATLAAAGRLAEITDYAKADEETYF